MNTRPPHPLRRHALAGALAAALLLVAPAGALAANSWPYATQDGTQLDLQFATDRRRAPDPPPELCPAGTPPLPHAPPNVEQASNPNQRFVMALYQDLLGRSADAPGLATLTSLLGSGGTRTQIAGVLLGSAEYRGNLVAS